jgi:hypothetical protein
MKTGLVCLLAALLSAPTSRADRKDGPPTRDAVRYADVRQCGHQDALAKDGARNDHCNPELKGEPKARPTRGALGAVYADGD